MGDYQTVQFGFLILNSFTALALNGEDEIPAVRRFGIAATIESDSSVSRVHPCSFSLSIRLLFASALRRSSVTSEPVRVRLSSLGKSARMPRSKLADDCSPNHRLVRLGEARRFLSPASVNELPSR